MAARHFHTLLRWLAVLPAAILAAWVVYFACGFASAALAGVFGASASYYVRLLLYYAPKQAAFVVVGGHVSPKPLATAFVLAVTAVAMSLMIHILGQRSVGATNYLHFTLESAGAILGVAFCGVTRRHIAAERN